MSYESTYTGAQVDLAVERAMSAVQPEDIDELPQVASMEASIVGIANDMILTQAIVAEHHAFD